MQSNRSEYSHRWQYSDRSSRHDWDDYDDRWEEKWEERREPHRDIPQDSYQKYGRDGRSSTERTNRNREYSDSPKMLYSKDSLNREWSRKSSARRRMSSPHYDTSEKKRRRYTEDDQDDYRYRREPQDKTNRQSPDSFSRAHVTKDFKHTLPQEEDFKYRKTPQDSRHRYQHEEFAYRQQHDDCRQSSGYYKDRDGHERSRERSQERARSQDRSTKSYANPRERNDGPSTDHEEYRQTIRRFPLNGSSGESFESDVTNQSAAVPEQKSDKGFQRFLDVLNKGVNVSTLTKIVSQTSTEVADQSHFPTSFTSTDRPWSPSYAGRQQGSYQNISHWSESEGSQRLASPPPRHRSFSPQERSPSDEKSLQRGDAEQSYFRSNSRSRSPSVAEKITLTPEDEHKNRHMQDVLRAIGMDFGTEELGQMSHRIQERLYGKKDCDGGHLRRGSGERGTRRAFSPRPRSRSSSSSRSSFIQLNQEYYKKEDSYSAQRDVTEVHQVQAHDAVEYGHNSSSSALQESEKCETYSHKSTAACQAFNQNSTYTLSKPSPAPVMPMYSPVNCSPLTYPGLPPPLPPPLLQALPPPLPPPLPPSLGRLGLLPHPRLPPFFPYPHVPPLNMFPAILAQTRHLLPQHIRNPPFLNLPLMNPIQPLNTTQKSKTVSRPRCLQVIETKQPG